MFLEIISTRGEEKINKLLFSIAGIDDQCLNVEAIEDFLNI